MLCGLDLQSLSSRADKLFRATREQIVAEQTAAAAATAKAGVSAEELARRQAFLRAQRELLLSKKKAEG